MKFEQELINRIMAPTPKFFKAVRRVGVVLGTVGTALLAAPVVLPAMVTTVAGYLVAAGLVATAVSSAAVADGAAGAVQTTNAPWGGAARLPARRTTRSVL